MSADTRVNSPKRNPLDDSDVRSARSLDSVERHDETFERKYALVGIENAVLAAREKPEAVLALLRGKVLVYDVEQLCVGRHGIGGNDKTRRAVGHVFEGDCPRLHRVVVFSKAHHRDFAARGRRGARAQNRDKQRRPQNSFDKFHNNALEMLV